ncbi:MAG: carbon storage regulator [Novosphingobium sp.]
MLVISRKFGESLHIGDNIEVVVLDIQDNKVTLGITTPSDVNVVPNELHWKSIENTLSGLLDPHRAD